MNIPVLCIISCCFTISTAENVSITDGATLSKYLCPDTGTLPPNTHLLLSKPQMILPNEGPRFCLIENTTNLSISPSQDVLSEGHDYVTISCSITYTGFGFFNITNLAVDLVMFDKCSGYSSIEAVKYVNERSQFLYYDGFVRMVLFFSHCYSIQLHNVLTSQFIVGVNLCGDSKIVTQIVTQPPTTMTMLVYFTDTALVPLLPRTCNLNITTNTMYYGRAELKLGDKVLVDGYSGFTLFLTQSFAVNVDLKMGANGRNGKSIDALVVFMNSGTASRVSYQGYDQPSTCSNSAASLRVLFYETSDFNSSVADNTKFPMWIHDTAFTGYEVFEDVLVIQKFTGKLSQHVTLDNISWCNIQGYSALLVAQNLAANPSLQTVGTLYLSLNNMYAWNNLFYIRDRYNNFLQTSSTLCLMYFTNIQYISLTGTNYFAENGGGTVIKLVASELAVSGNLTIMDGYAYQGGGISIDDLSTLILEEPLVAGFYNNIADQGSTIFAPAKRNNFLVNSNIQLRPDRKYSLANVTSIKISLYFSNSTEIHSSFYAPLFSYFGSQTSPNFLFDRTTWDPDRSQFAYTTLIDTILHMDRMDKYTSLYNGLCIHLRGKDWDCGYMDQLDKQGYMCPGLHNTTVYPGQTAFSVTLHTNDHYEYTVACCNVACFDDTRYIRHSISTSNNVNMKHFWFQVSPASVSSDYHVVLIRDGEHDAGISGSILQFNFSDCPPGFSLRNGSCVCDSKLVSHVYSCDIDTEGFVGPPGYWTGLAGHTLIFDGLCHPNYCDSDKLDFHLTDDPAEACLGNRTGVLCGECKENYSVVFGSDTCYDHCTDMYLLTIPLYALAGLLLVFLLFVLRITVATGTINGPIFYANVLGLILDKLTENRVQT